jgi:hypothetical protein
MSATGTLDYLVRIGPPARGDTVHRHSCRFAARAEALRWVWADRIGFGDIDWDTVRSHGLKPCRVCRPELLREGGHGPDYKP